MAWAQWVVAVSAFATALFNGLAWRRHASEDKRRFEAHGARITDLENR